MFVTAERGEVVVDAADRRTRGAIRRERVRRGRTDEAVERGALHRRVEQRLVRVLAVQVDERRAELGELARGREPAVDVGAAPTVARDHTREHRLVTGVGIDEPPFDTRFVAPVAHERRVGAPTHQQLERFDDERLARAGLAGDRGQAGSEQQVEVGHDAEVDDVQLGQHLPRRSYRSARPNLALRI